MGSTPSEEDRTAALERRIEELEKRQQQGNSQQQQQQQQSSGGMNAWLHIYIIGTSTAASLSLFSLFRDFIKIHQFLLDFVNAWAAIVRPIADFLFSWAFEIFGFTMPVWVGDYLIVGFIVTLGRIRAYTFRRFHYNRSLFKNGYLRFAYRTAVSLFLWPYYIFEVIYKCFYGKQPTVPWKVWLYFILSPFIYFIILLLANYTAFFIWTGAAS